MGKHAEAVDNVGVPFVSVAGILCPHARTPGCRWRIGYPATRLRESKRTSFPWEGYGFWRPSVVHATAQPSPTPHCRSKRTEPGAFTSANHTRLKIFQPGTCFCTIWAKHDIIALPWASCCSSRVLSCLWKSRIIRDVRGPRQRAFRRRCHIMHKTWGNYLQLLY